LRKSLLEDKFKRSLVYFTELKDSLISKKLDQTDHIRLIIDKVDKKVKSLSGELKKVRETEAQAFQLVAE